MTSSLLDVNVLIALLDPSHVHHDRAHRWFERESQQGWLSCPTTQNAVLRIVSNPRYPNAQPMELVLDSLESLLAVDSHTFVADSETLLGTGVNREKLSSSAQVTDTYLLLLAASHKSRLATFDTRLVTSSVPGGKQVVLHIS